MLGFSFDASHWNCAVTFKAHLHLYACPQLTNGVTHSYARAHTHTMDTVYPQHKHATQTQTCQNLCMWTGQTCV